MCRHTLKSFTMNFKSNYDLFLCTMLFGLLIISIVNEQSIYGDFGDGSGGDGSGGNPSGGGGCSNCVSPTIAFDKSGSTRLVENGISFSNGNIFDVELYTHNLPLQSFHVDETISVDFQIYEDQGYDNISYAKLSIIDYMIKGGIIIDSSKSSIVWDNGVVTTNDQNQLFGDANATLIPNDDYTATAGFSFSINEELPTSTLKFEVRDADNNNQYTYFFDSFKITSVQFLDFVDTHSDVNLPNLLPEQNNSPNESEKQNSTELEDLIQIESERKDALNIIVSEHVERGEYAEALNVYEILKKEFSSDHNVYNDYGYAYLQAGLDNKALEKFEQGLEISPDDIRLQNNRIIAIFNLGNYDLALEESDKTLEQSPNDPTTLGMKSLILVVMERYDDGEIVANEILKINPVNVDALTTLAVLEIEKQNFATAYYYLSIVIEQDPNFFYALLLQSMVADEINDTDASLNSIHIADSLQADALKNISSNALKVKYFKEDANPIESIKLILANSYFDSLEYDKSLILVDDILIDNPDNLDANELKEKINTELNNNSIINEIQIIKSSIQIIIVPILLFSLFLLFYYHIWKRRNPKRFFISTKKTTTSSPIITRNLIPVTRKNVQYKDIMDAVHIVAEVSILALTLILIMFTGGF